jgi:hypothetical protein
LVAWAFLALVGEALARRADAAEDELTRGIANIILQAVTALGE